MLRYAVRFQLARPSESAWRFLILVMSLIATGCTDSIHTKSLPAPVPESDEYVLTGKVLRLWGGDNYEFGETERLHYILLRGVDTPKPGQPFFGMARNRAYWMMISKKLRVEVSGRDEAMREISDVFVVNEDPADIAGDLNVGLELLRMGFGWYDGEEFELAETYKAAEAEARAKKIGIWSLENPVPPWEFYQKKIESHRENLPK